MSFREPKIQFSTGSPDVKDEFKNILNDFYPRYLNVLWDFKNDIDELRLKDILHQNGKKLLILMMHI